MGKKTNKLLFRIHFRQRLLMEQATDIHWSMYFLLLSCPRPHLTVHWSRGSQTLRSRATAALLQNQFTSKTQCWHDVPGSLYGCCVKVNDAQSERKSRGAGDEGVNIHHAPGKPTAGLGTGAGSALKGERWMKPPHARGVSFGLLMWSVALDVRRRSCKQFALWAAGVFERVWLPLCSSSLKGMMMKYVIVKNPHYLLRQCASYTFYFSQNKNKHGCPFSTGDLSWESGKTSAAEMFPLDWDSHLGKTHNLLYNCHLLDIALNYTRKQLRLIGKN